MRLNLNREPRFRLNLALTERSKQRLERLAKLTEADTNAEVIRNALQLYESIIHHLIDGKELMLRDRKTGQICVYEALYNIGIAEDGLKKDDLSKVQVSTQDPDYIEPTPKTSTSLYAALR